MHALFASMQDNLTDILFNVAAILICFLIARVLHARQPVALAFAFMPVLVGWAFTDPAARTLVSGLF